MLATPSGAVVLFFDNFNRLDSPTVGNGWTEVDGSNLKSFIQSNTLMMSQDGGLDASTNDGQDTRIYRVGSQHNDITLSGTLRMDGTSQIARVVVRSEGTEGDGFCTNTNTGAISHPACGQFATNVFNCPSPGCWRGDGYGFAAHIEGNVQIVDDGTELAQAAFSFLNGTTYKWEMQINPQNNIRLFIWTGGTKPGTPTLEFTNGGNPYTPVANGNNWQVEVRNANDNIGDSHAHSATWDNFQVATFDSAGALTVNKSGNGSGKVVSSPPGLDCGLACTADFANKKAVKLIANPDPGSVFIGWDQPGCVPEKPCTVRLAETNQVEAKFIQRPQGNDPKIIYLGICGAGYLFEDACLDGSGWFDPRLEPVFDSFNPLNDNDLATVGEAFSGLISIGLRVGTLFPNSVVLVASFSVGSAVTGHDLLGSNAGIVEDFINNFYNSGDRVYLAGHSYGGRIVSDVGNLVTNTRIHNRNP